MAKAIPPPSIKYQQGSWQQISPLSSCSCKKSSPHPQSRGQAQTFLFAATPAPALHRLLIKCSSPHKQGEASEIIRPPSTSEPRLTSDRQLGKVPNDVPWTLQRRPAPERDLMAQRADGLVCTAEPARASSAGLDLVSPSHRSITTQQTELIRH